MLGTLRKMSHSKRAPSGDLEVSSENPLYMDDSVRPFSTSALDKPSWFSARYGSFFDKSTEILYGNPMVGIQVRVEGSSVWTYAATDGYIGAPLYVPEPMVYQRKLSVPPWLLFLASPDLEAELLVDENDTLVLSVTKETLHAALMHYQKAVRDPSLLVLSDIIGRHKSVCVAVSIVGTDIPIPKALRNGIPVEAKLNIWFRQEIKTYAT